MRLRFLEQARRDLTWFRRYYAANFPEGDNGAKRSYNATKTLLKEHPFAGEVQENTDLREIRVLRTPFSFVYRVKEDEIQILRIWDGRRDRPENWDKR